MTKVSYELYNDGTMNGMSPFIQEFYSLNQLIQWIDQKNGQPGIYVKILKITQD